MATSNTSTQKPAAAPRVKSGTPSAKPVRKTPAVAAQAPKTATPTSPAAPVSSKTDKKKVKVEKVKVVRDSFTIPKTEYAQIASLKKRALDLGLEVKKSELLRAGLLLLTGSSDAALRKALGSVPTLKTGRPQKD